MELLGDGGKDFLSAGVVGVLVSSPLGLSSTTCPCGKESCRHFSSPELPVNPNAPGKQCGLLSEDAFKFQCHISMRLKSSGLAMKVVGDKQLHCDNGW